MAYAGSGAPRRRNTKDIDWTVRPVALNPDTGKIATCILVPAGNSWTALVGSKQNPIEVQFKDVRFRFEPRTRVYDSDGNVMAVYYGNGRPATETEIADFLSREEKRFEKRTHHSLVDVWREALGEDDDIVY